MELTYYERNKERLKKKARARYRKKRKEIRAYQNSVRQSPEAKKKAREYQLTRKFGITAERYDEMLAAQNGLCALCGGPPNGQWNRLHVDHDHASGRIRGLLCQDCNTALGLLKDSPNLMEKAAIYVRSHSE